MGVEVGFDFGEFFGVFDDFGDFTVRPVVIETFLEKGGGVRDVAVEDGGFEVPWWRKGGGEGGEDWTRSTWNSLQIFKETFIDLLYLFVTKI